MKHAANGGMAIITNVQPPAVRSVTRFGIVGLAVFALDFGLLWFFQWFLPPLWAVSIAYLLAVATHFCLNKWWVFSSREPTNRGQLGRYALTVAICWLTTVSLVSFSLQVLAVNVYVAKLLAMAPTTLLGFLLMRSFVFKTRPA